MSAQQTSTKPPAGAAAIHPAEMGAGLRPLTWGMLARVLAVGTVVSLFFALLGPLGSGVLPLLRRMAQVVGYGWIGALLGLTSARLIGRTRLWRNVVAAGISTGLLMSPAMFAVVWGGARLAAGHPIPLGDIPEMLWQTVLVCVAMSFMAVAFARRRVVILAPPGRPRFLDRLPPRLREGELWAVEAEDHYLRLHTSKGQDLILMRLADALEELEGIEGAQVHRSWWVARAAITEAQRGDGRATLTLKDGSQAPVSRTYARMLRERRWI